MLKPRFKTYSIFLLYFFRNAHNITYKDKFSKRPDIDIGLGVGPWGMMGAEALLAGYGCWARLIIRLPVSLIIIYMQYYFICKT
jgi:hypothetical protein